MCYSHGKVPKACVIFLDVGSFERTGFITWALELLSWSFGKSFCPSAGIVEEGKTPPLLKNACEESVVGEDRHHHNPYPCGINKGWSQWFDRELRDPSIFNILCRTGVLDAIFLSKACDIHIEAKMLRHVVRRWSTETHTFICSWGEFTPTLEDVAKIFHLPICGSQDPFSVTLTLEDSRKLEILRKGAPTAPSTSLRFSNWIQYFGDANRDELCHLAALISLWLGRFIFYDFSQDCLHQWVFSLALAIARGSVIPLAPMGSRDYGCGNPLELKLMQVFLWESFKGLDMPPLSHSRARLLVDSGKGSYLPERLPLVCRWSQRMQRKGHNFLELLDGVDNFVFRPYCVLPEEFKHVPFYPDSDGLVEAPAMITWRSLCIIHRIELDCNLGLIKMSLSIPAITITLHCIAGRERVGGFSKAYQAYSNRYFASFSRFHAAPCNRLLPTTVRHARLVSEEKAISLSQKGNLPFTSKSGKIVGDFSKLKTKLEKLGSHGARRSAVCGKRKREESCSAEKKQAVKEPRRFIPKVAASGPLRAKGNATLESSPHQELVASGSSKHVGKASEALPSHSEYKRLTHIRTPYSKSKDKGAPAIPKRQSMRILQARFVDTRRGKGESSRAKVVVTVDDDESNESDAVETEIDTHKQESVRSVGGMDEDLDEDQYYNCDEGAYTGPDTRSEEPDDSNVPPGFAGGTQKRVWSHVA
ncbi:uncharacterized protein Pyn_01636 [Prunus yedoensis var. nudiflora]|uniref:Aminotransferase-like plant mobile domain-containing protein n=1 Tax=Prunus yedoensis var. nudiflora TaxID=2094558 RepID=A0A314YL13_PRUYE|nr:uncharacterized protein Pyn_01636 [Prunus yedoensis var. nudiflora]